MSNQMTNYSNSDFIDNVLKNSLNYLYNFLNEIETKEFYLNSDSIAIDHVDTEFIDHTFALIKLEISNNNEIIVFYNDINSEDDNTVCEIPLLQLSKPNIVIIANAVALINVRKSK